MHAIGREPVLVRQTSVAAHWDARPGEDPANPRAAEMRPRIVRSIEQAWRRVSCRHRPGCGYDRAALRASGNACRSPSATLRRCSDWTELPLFAAAVAAQVLCWRSAARAQEQERLPACRPVPE